MTGSSDLPRKRHKWLGRLLGCFSAKRHGGGNDNGSSCHENQEWPQVEPSQGPDCNDNQEQRSINARQHCTENRTAWCRTRDPQEKAWVGCGPILGDLEWALLKEGLLEYRDPAASIPVLSICHGFSDEELRTLSRRGRYVEVCGLQRTARKLNRRLNGEVKEGADKMLWVEYLEPCIDGLPASVWLECVEPTLAILISLSSLRHRRSNLSLKKGAQGVLDSSRCRHGDFEFGPIAIFHHPGRIQQMMLLRFEFVNVPGVGQPNAVDVIQPPDNTSGRNFNRHRRFRDHHRPVSEGGPRARDSDNNVHLEDSLATSHAAREHQAAGQSTGHGVDDDGLSMSTVSMSNIIISSNNNNSNNNNSQSNFVSLPGTSGREQRLRDAERVKAESETRRGAPQPAGPVFSDDLDPRHDGRGRTPGLRTLQGDCNYSNNANDDAEPPTTSSVVTDRQDSVAGEGSNYPSTSGRTAHQLPPGYIDRMALGDHTMWTLAPGHYASLGVPCRSTWRSTAVALTTQGDWNGGGAVAVAAAAAVRVATAAVIAPENVEQSRLGARRHLWNCSRRLARRARFGLSRWRSRLQRSVMQPYKTNSSC